MIHFWGDPHLGHENILKYCRRPFATIEEHDRVLIENYNARVMPGDEVWILGDLCWWHLDPDKIRAYYEQLNGYKHLIIGNHDTDEEGEVLPVLRDLFGDNRLHWYKEIAIGDDGRRRQLGDRSAQRLVLFHYAITRFQYWKSFKAGQKPAWHLYGHHHDRLKHDASAFDVGVDSTDYVPLSWPEVARRMRRETEDPI